MPNRKSIIYALRFLCIILVFSFALSSSGQTVPSFGLGFYNNESVQDRRTGLDLTPEAAFAFHAGTVDLSFDFSFLSGHNNFFGYILRLIRNNTQNFDLLYDKANLAVGHFRMVAGDNPPFATFTLDSNHLFNSWNTIRVTIDAGQDRLILRVGKDIFVQKGLHLSSSDSFRICFGACPIQQFKTTDVPPMRIRDIRISKGHNPLCYWPLNEEKGATALETLGGKNGTAANPLWLRSTHCEWKPLDSLIIDGAASCAFDSRNGVLYLIGRDSLMLYNLGSGTRHALPYTSGRQDLLVGNQSVYDPFDRKLYNLYPDQQLAANFDLSSMRWDGKYQPGDINFWHVNKFCTALDSSIYVLNGYGHMLYRNSIFRYHIPTNSWETIVPKGDPLVPRYLAAAGTTNRADTLYLIGGYGSSSGQQIRSPHNLYDLMRFDVRTRTFRRLFELSPATEGFAFANSLVIDQKNRSFYGLTFNNGKYYTDLQMIKASLDGPGYQPVGDKIPYPFHDIESFADLYYSPSLNRFLAVALFTDSTRSRPLHTMVHLYSLDGPPETYIAETTTNPPPRSHNYYLWIGLIALIISAIGATGAALYSRRRRLVNHRQATPVPLINPGSVPINPASPAPNHPAIFLFGEMQVFDREGNDLTRQFSPLLKQLFLILLLHSLKNKRGISSEKLNEILWFDKEGKSARNNRSVNIAKLRALLDKTGGCSLGKETGYWKIDIDPERVRVDYLEYLAIVYNREALDKGAIEALAAITSRGSMLKDVEYPWLDSFKSDVSNHVIDTYLHFAQHNPADPEFMIGLADYIFYFDAVNEDAMIIKCRALVQLGKHSLARNTYTVFQKEYRHLYGQDFERDFHSVLQE
jgi:DNA-binding SARP family transcriptional activator